MPQFCARSWKTTRRILLLCLALYWIRKRRVRRSREALQRALISRRRIADLRRKHAEELTLISAIVTQRLLLKSVRQKRMMWTKPRSRTFFCNVVSGWEDAEWKRNFRIGRPTFNFLCLQLTSVLQRREVIRKTLSVEETCVLVQPFLTRNLRLNPSRTPVRTRVEPAC